MFAWRPLKRAESWSAPSPGLPAGPDTSTRPEDKSPTPSTMGHSSGRYGTAPNSRSRPDFQYLMVNRSMAEPDSVLSRGDS